LVVVAAAAYVLSACSASSNRVVVPPVPPPSTARTAVNTERDALQFRAVQAVLPYAGTAATTCQNGRIVAPAASDVPSADIILADRADHVVESAPTVNQGITGRDITISGNFDEATARSIAKQLS
jgi:preprotein translocase subunit SecD